MAAALGTPCLPAHPLLKLVSGPAAIRLIAHGPLEAAAAFGVFGRPCSSFLRCHSFLGLAAQAARPGGHAGGPGRRVGEVPGRGGECRLCRATSRWGVPSCALDVGGGRGKPGSGWAADSSRSCCTHPGDQGGRADLPDDDPGAGFYEHSVSATATPKPWLVCATDWVIQADENSNSRLSPLGKEICSTLSYASRFGRFRRIKSMP